MSLSRPALSRLWAGLELLYFRRSRPLSNGRRVPQPGEAAIQIFLQILEILEPDMEAKRRPSGRPARRRSISRTIERDHEAFEAAPGIADAKQFETVDHRCDSRLRHGLQHRGEQAR